MLIQRSAEALSVAIVDRTCVDVDATMSRPAKVAKTETPIEDIAKGWLEIDYVPQTKKVVEDLLAAGDKPVPPPPGGRNCRCLVFPRDVLHLMYCHFVARTTGCMSARLRHVIHLAK